MQSSFVKKAARPGPWHGRRRFDITMQQKKTRTCKGMFSAFTQALHDLNLPEEDIRVLNKIIPDFHFDL